MVASLDLAKSIYQTKLTEKSDSVLLPGAGSIRSPHPGFSAHHRLSLPLSLECPLLSLDTWKKNSFSHTLDALSMDKQHALPLADHLLDDVQYASKAAEARNHSSGPLTIEGWALSLDTARRLLRIWDDQPKSCTWLSQSWWREPFFTHLKPHLSMPVNLRCKTFKNTLQVFPSPFFSLMYKSV